MQKKGVELELLKILRQHSDEDHPLTTNQIIEYLDEKNLHVKRQTVYTHLKLLKSMGYEILKIGNKHYYADWGFERSEVLLLVQSIIANPILPRKHSIELCNKLLETQGKFYKEENKELYYLDNSQKKDNRYFFNTIEEISQAIKENKNLLFMYTKYNVYKQIENKYEERIEVTPHFIACNREKLYLVCTKDGVIRHYRVDKMIDASIGSNNTIDTHIDPSTYSQGRIFMHSGELMPVKFKCDNRVLDDVIDRFGDHCTITKIDDNQFYLSTNMTKTEVPYFVSQFIQYIQVVEPQDLVNTVVEILEDALKKYKH